MDTVTQIINNNQGRRVEIDYLANGTYDVNGIIGERTLSRAFSGKNYKSLKTAIKKSEQWLGIQ